MSDELLQNAMAAMVESDDVSDILAYLIAGCSRAYPSDAVAILVRSGPGDLELLSASSHRVEELELLQIQTDRGPCVDVLAENSSVIVNGRDELIRHWGSVGEHIANAGFHGAHAYPLHWKGRAFGGLNIFVGSGVDPNPALGQFYADLATVALVHPGELATDALVDRVRAAIDARVVIEQAKGALAYQRDLEIHHAYHVLLEEARNSGTGLREYATRILAQAMGS